MGRLVRLQRWLCSCCQPSRRNGLCGHQLGGIGWRCDLVSPRLQTREEVVNCWLLLWCHRWPCCYHPMLRIRSCMVCSRLRCPRCSRLQLWNQVEVRVRYRRRTRYFRRPLHWRLGWQPLHRIFCCVSFSDLSYLLAANSWSSDYIVHLDGFSEISGGWLNQHWIQLAYQLADSVSGFAYSFGGSCAILFVMNIIPGLSLRATEEEELLGIDDAEIGEFAVCSTPSSSQ
jgi:hypothetical protein